MAEQVGSGDSATGPRALGERYLAHLRALRGSNWLLGPSDLYRCAAVTVADGPHDPEAFGADMRRMATDLRAALPIWSALRSDVRLPIAGFLMCRGLSVAEAVRIRREALALFRAEGLGYAEPYGYLAALLLHAHPQLTGGLRPDAVRRMRGYARLLRGYYWLSYYHDILPLLALHGASNRGPADFLESVRRTVGALRNAGFRTGMDRLRAALLIEGAPASHHTVIRDMQEWRTLMRRVRLPSRRAQVSAQALAAQIIGRPDRARIDDLRVLYEVLRVGRPRADRHTAINQALVLMSWDVLAQAGDGAPDPRSALLADAHFAYVVAANQVAVDTGQKEE